MIPSYYSYSSYDPRGAIRYQLRQDTAFCGRIVLSILLTQIVCSIGLGIAARLGILAVGQDFYGLPAPVFQLMTMLLYVGYLMVPPLVVAAAAHRLINPFAGQRKVESGVFAAAICCGMALAMLCNFLTNVLVGIATDVGIPLPDSGPSLDGTLPTLIIALLSTAILPAILEEMAFRGFILHALLPYGKGIAIIISSLLFGLLHGNLIQIPFAFMLGLVLAYLTVQTGNIRIAAVIHAGNNALSVLLEHFTRGMNDADANRLAIAAYAVICAIGTIGFLLIALRQRLLEGRFPDILHRVDNGSSRLTVRERLGTILTTPSVIVFIVLIVAEVLVSIVEGLLA